MGSVNANVRVALPMTTPIAAADPAAPATPAATDGWTVGDMLTAMGGNTKTMLEDGASNMGWNTHEDGSLATGVNPLGALGFGTVTVGPTALLAATRPSVNPLTAQHLSYGERLGLTASSTGLRITPTLVSAVAGPAIADGMTLLAPNLVKKYKSTTAAAGTEERKKADRNNQSAKISRAVAGGAVVGLGAGVLFLLKPQIFAKLKLQAADGTGLIDRAIQGTTHYTINGGEVRKLSGVLNESQIRASLAGLARPIADDDAVNVVKTIAPMAKDAAFSNRAILGSAGALGTLLLTDRTVGEADPERRARMMQLTAAVGALTIGGTYGIGKLTSRSMLANSGAGGLLAKNQLLLKPNIEWIKKYAGTIAPITAVPAGTSASQYMSVVDDFDDITSTRSPFRK